jgi:isoquinoline 1-oxidoreductase beta subunit
MTKISRRGFIKASVSAAGGLTLGFSLPVFSNARPFERTGLIGSELNAWLTIEPDDSILIRVAQAEMGQGVMTSLPMLIAEELEADWRTIKVEYADVNRQILGNGIFGRMNTRESDAVVKGRKQLQLAGAQARERLLKAAAEKWMVSPADCYADYGRIYRKASSDSFGYGELASLAAEVTVANVRIKTPEAFNILGLPTPRLDVPAKVDGSAIYSMDVRVPDMVYAAVIHCPVLGGRLQSLRFNAIRHLPGVLKAVRMESSVAVVAETFWQAKKAADQLPVFWNLGPGAKTFSDTIKRDFFEKFSEDGDVILEKGDAVTLMYHAGKTIESDYYVPYLAQAPLEPMNCTVQVQQDRVDVWVGHQNPEAVVDVVAKLTGEAPYDVYVHNCYLGGSFGRRSHTDFVEEATRIALETGTPVQMIWTREEEMRSGAYRPMSAMRFKAGFDIEKELVALTNHSVTHSISYDRDGEFSGVDESSVEGLRDHAYELPAYKFTHTRKNKHLSSWWWRSGGHSINAFGMECFIDEMAVAARKDPFEFRRSLLQSKPDHLEVLEKLEQQSRWKKAQLPKGTAQGMAIHESYGTICGQVAEVTVNSDGSVRVNKVTAVVDCGNLVNPMTAEEQIEGGILFGLTAALNGKLTIENGRVLEDNLDTYEIIRMAEAPEIDIHWITLSTEHWGGLGEPSTPVIAPAVCNALYKITGRRIRSLPIRDYYLQIK